MKFGSEEVQREVLSRVARGEAVLSMGYTEPSAGSDVAAVSTRAWSLSARVALKAGHWLQSIPQQAIIISP